MSRTTRLAVSFLVSAAFIGGLASFVDVSELRDVQTRLRPEFVLPLIAALMAVIVSNAYRWYRLLDGSVPLTQSFAATLLGMGGNMILPLRGGDLLRVYHSGRAGESSTHKALSRLMLEKLLDLVCACLMGSLALMWISYFGSTPKASELSAIAWPLLAATIAGALFAWALFSHVAPRMEALLLRIPVGQKMIRHGIEVLQELREGSSTRSITFPALFTVLMWLLIYAPTYILIGQTVGVDIDFIPVMVIMLAATVGYAIPAAPSALGTLHASLVSAFVILGRSASEGLIYAVAVHAVFFIAFAAAAALVYPFVHTNFARR